MITSSDVQHAAEAAVGALRPRADADWSVAAPDLDWSVRRTVDHIGDALMFYSVQLATRSPERVPPVRRGHPEADHAGLLGAIEGAASILARLADGAGPAARGFHPTGSADTEGFMAMGCDEVLVHTYDAVGGLGGEFRPESDLAARVVARLFPWAPPGHDPWDTLLWCNGRAGLPDRPRLAPDWSWHCAPLDEWDGEVHKSPF